MWITFVAQYETSYPQLILIMWDIDVDKSSRWVKIALRPAAKMNAMRF